GPAAKERTSWIETRANEYLANRLRGVRRVPFAQALKASTTHEHDYISNYVGDLKTVLDLDVVRSRGLRLGVDPLGGAGVHYWPRVADAYGLNLTVVNSTIDPTFRFIPLDWDGRIRMDPSSSYVTKSAAAMKDKFDVSFGCDPDHDRHGILTKSAGL